MTKDSETGRLIMSRFDVSLWWSNRAPEDDWAVYVLSTAESLLVDSAVVYVGMARDVRRRLSEHGRYWVGEQGTARVIVVDSEIAARRLEAALISLLNPSGNTQRPKLSWVETRYYEQFRELWRLRRLGICPGCFCVCEEGFSQDGGRSYLPITEPDPECTAHLGPARAAMIRQETATSADEVEEIPTMNGNGRG